MRFLLHDDFFSEHLKKHYKANFSTSDSNDPIAKRNYRKSNDIVELFSEMYYFLLVKISVPGIVLPPLVLTIVNYYVYDMGNESYFLPFPFL